MNPDEIWQVDANGTIYETSFDELKQWIVEGAVLPSDKIRRGELRWLEAGKVPLLHGVFNQKFAETPPQIQTNITQLTPTNDTQINTFANVSPPTAQPIIETPSPQAQTPPTPFITEVKQTHQTQTHQPKSSQTNVHANQNECSIHLGTEAKFVCVSCENLFCRACPKSYGEVKICPTCGEMCKSLVEVQQKNRQQSQYQNAIAEGFGIGDFVNAFTFPFKHPISLLIGGVMFAVFSIGQSALSLGAIEVAVGGIFGMLLSNAIVFACLSNTIDEFSKGNLTANFMPTFDDFNLWDDVVHPFFLSIGIGIITYGFLVILIVGGVFTAYNSMKNTANPLNLPVAGSMNVPNPSPIINQFEELKRKDAEQKAKMSELFGQNYPNQRATNAQSPNQSATNAQSPNQKIANTQIPNQTGELEYTENIGINPASAIESYQKGQAESVLGASPQTEQMRRQQMISALTSYGLPFILLAFLGLLWVVFYYPAACLVAGYTRNFTAVLNPLVGFDTIKRMGSTYAKIVAMTILLAIFSATVMSIVSAVLSPFDLPTLGNIPATLINSIFSFYIYVVYAAILGYAVYKSKNLLNN